MNRGHCVEMCTFTASRVPTDHIGELPASCSRKGETLPTKRTKQDALAHGSMAFLNPLYIYSVFWTVVLLLYSLGWSTIYEPLQPGLLVFFSVTIVLSAMLGLILQNRLNFHRIKEPRIDETKPSNTVTRIIVAGYFAEFLYVGHVPLIDDLILHSGYKYGHFPGIPVFDVLLVTFSVFYAVYLAYQSTRAAGRRWRALVLQFFVIESMFILLLNREAFVLCLLMATFILLSTTKLTGRRIMATCLFAFVVMYLFGCIGNMREGFSYSDNSYIIELSNVSTSYPHWLPGQFLWTYMYLVSPFGNLNALVAHMAPTSDLSSMTVNLLPDFISKKMAFFNPSTPLVSGYFTVSTGYASAWKFNGYMALYLTYGALLLFVLVAIRATRASLEKVSLAIACGVVVFMVYTNALAYSGVSFALAYPALAFALAFPVPRSPRLAPSSAPESGYPSLHSGQGSETSSRARMTR